MLPIFFTIAGFSFSSLGVLISLAFLLTFFIVWRRLREMGWEEGRVVDNFLLSSLAAVVFSRFVFIISHGRLFGWLVSRWLFFHRYPGFSFWGAVVGFLASWWFLVKREKRDFFKIADELVFGLLPFTVLAQLGMFLDGSNLGGETGSFLGLFFPGDPVRRHPVTLFYAILLVFLWIFFLKIERRWRTWPWYKSQAEGFILFGFFFLLATLNFSLAFLKPRGLYSSLLEKLTSCLVLVLALAGFYWRSGRKFNQDYQAIKNKFKPSNEKKKKKKKRKK